MNEQEMYAAIDRKAYERHGPMVSEICGEVVEEVDGLNQTHIPAVMVSSAMLAARQAIYYAYYIAGCYWHEGYTEREVRAAATDLHDFVEQGREKEMRSIDGDTSSTETP